MFYEQPWALVHWLQLGRGREHSPREEMDEYLALVEAGKTDVEAFEQAFGVSMKQLRTQLIDYLNGKYQAVAIPLAPFGHKSVPPSVRQLAQDEITLALGELALDHEDSPLAQELFVAARAANPNNARAHAGIGGALAMRDLWDEAEPHYLRALEIDPQSAENELDYAKYLHFKSLQQDDPGQRGKRLIEARRHYARSWELDSKIPETYAMYGKSFLAPGEDPAASLESLEHAHALLPSNSEILKLLAKAYVMADRIDDARPLVERIVANTHSGDRVAKVDAMLDEIAKGDVDPK